MPKATSSADFGAELSPGLRVCGGRYLLKRLIGRAEFSEIWLARDIRNARDIALKFLPKAFLQDANLLEFFQDEVRRETLLKHPHIVAIHELARDHDAAAIVMEFVDGWSLAALKVDKPGRRYSIQEIEPWVHQLCGALAYAHDEFGIIHADLKPSNLLVSARDGIKISDFGFAAHVRNESSKRGIIKGGYTGIGFLSPQQVMGEMPDKADDIYSLGATIFDLLTGTPPFYKGEVVAQICSLKPPRVAQRLTDLGIRCEIVSAVWEETLAACLAKNRSDRPQSVKEFLHLLERPEIELSRNDLREPDESLPSATASTIVTADGTPSATRPKQFTLLVMAIAVAFVVVSLIGVFWAVRNGKMAAALFRGHIGPASAGSLDTQFNAGTGADDSIWCLAPLPDGKILIGGVFKDYDGVADRGIARLQADGAIDTTFHSEVVGDVSTIVPLDNGKILVGGQGLLAGQPARKLVRLNADGSLDEAFGGESYNRAVVTVTTQADGKVLVGGRFMTVAGKRHGGLVRLTTDGNLDSSLDIGAGASAAVLAVEVQPDGKILVGGEFRKFNGRQAGHLVRLNPDGSFDSGFDTGDGADQPIWCFRLQKDGKILMSGSFNHVDGSLCPHIARLNVDGSLDAAFHAPDGLGNDLRCMAVQPDGKIVVGGIATVNGATRPFLVRLNADGSLDQSFQMTGATGNTFWGVRILPDGKILIAGRFNSVDGVLCGNVARLHD